MTNTRQERKTTTRLNLIIVLQLFLSVLPALSEELDGHVSETESFPSNSPQNTTTPPSNNQLPSWFGVNDATPPQSTSTATIDNNQLPRWFGTSDTSKPASTVRTSAHDSNDPLKTTAIEKDIEQLEDGDNRLKSLIGEVQRAEASENTSYTEVIHDEHGTRIIDWNKWVDNFNHKFLGMVKQVPEYQLWFRRQSNAEADFTFTVSRCGNISFIREYCNSQLLQRCAEIAISRMGYKKYLQFPAESRRNEFTFRSGVIAHKAPFPHAYGYEEQINN